MNINIPINYLQIGNCSIFCLSDHIIINRNLLKKWKKKIDFNIWNKANVYS